MSEACRKRRTCSGSPRAPSKPTCTASSPRQGPAVRPTSSSLWRGIQVRWRTDSRARSGGRRLRHYVVALLAGARVLAVEERLVGLGHRVVLVVVHHRFDLVQQAVAFGTEPLK